MAQSSYAGVIAWVDWQSTAPAVSGTITLADASQISVTFDGGIIGACLDSTCSNHWLPASTYQSATVDNAPPGGLLEITGGGGVTPDVYTITFGTPVVDPVIGIVSMGGGVTSEYDFSAPYTLLSSGGGFYGSGSFTVVSPTALQGAESNGVVGFTGTFSSISFAAPVYEAWQEITVGVPDPQTVPEPGAWSLMLAGMGLLGVYRLKRR